MTKKKRPKDTPAQRHARFVEAARNAGADESPDALDKTFKKIDLRRTQSPKKTML